MEIVSLETLKENKLISKSVKKVKIFGDTPVDTKITVEGINVTKGARISIEKAGGKIIDISSDVKNKTKKSQAKDDQE